jgi:hypothetical protein
MMPWPLFHRFMVNAEQLRLAIRDRLPKETILAEQRVILAEWDKCR